MVKYSAYHKMDIAPDLPTFFFCKNVLWNSKKKS